MQRLSQEHHWPNPAYSLGMLLMQAREEKPIRTTLQLANLIGGPSRRPAGKHRRPGSRTIHPATRVFQVCAAGALKPAHLTYLTTPDGSKVECCADSLRHAHLLQMGQCSCNNLNVH